MRAIGYMRRSQEVETVNGRPKQASLQVQQAAIEAEAKKIGADVVGLVIHDGVSGAKRSRFTELEQAVRDRNADAVIIYHFDRFGRDVMGELACLERLHDQGVKLFACNRGQVEIITSTGFLLTTIEAAVAQYNRMICSEKIKDALLLRRRQRRRVHYFPQYGERFTPDGRVELEPEHIKVLQTIDSLRKGKYSYPFIASYFLRRGIRTQQGKVWNHLQIARIYRRWIKMGRKPSWEI